MEAVKHSFLLKGYFRKKKKAEEKKQELLKKEDDLKKKKGTGDISPDNTKENHKQ